MGGSVGGSKSESKNKTQDSVWGPQGEALTGMYDQANNLFGNDFSSGMLQGMAPQLQQYMQSIMSGAQGGMNNMLGGGAYGDTSGIRNSLEESLNKSAQGGSQMGKMYESIVGGPGNTYIDPMVDSMKTGMMDNLDRMQSGVGADASVMGQGGSSRHAMQNAMLGSQANKDMTNVENQMRGNAYDTDLNMKMDIARMADTNMGGTQDRMMQMLGGADQNVGAGMGFGGQAQNLGMGSMAPWMQAGQSPWNFMNQYAGVLGNPTVLGSGSGSGSSKGMSGGGSMKG
jgi:hypothetical protein